LEGKRKTEAAMELGWKEGTVSSRLARARERLRARLSRRGVELSAVLGAVALTNHVTAAVPLPLINLTIQAGLEYAAGKIAASMSAEVLALAKGVTNAMFMTKVKAMMVLLLVAGVAAGGVATLAQRETATQPTAQLQTESPKVNDPQGERPGPTAQKQIKLDRYGDPLPPGALARMGTMRLRHTHPSLITTAFSPDGKILASGGWNEIRLWDMATGKLLREIRDDGNRTKSYCPLLFAPDGRWLAGACRDSVCIWDAATGRRIHEFPAKGQSIACSKDGKLLAASMGNGSITIWNTVTGKQTAELRQGNADRFCSIAFTADNTGLVALSENHRVCHWDLAQAKLRKAFKLPFPRNWCPVLSPGGQTLAVTPNPINPNGVPPEGPTSLWDTTTGKERLKLEGKLAHVCFGIAFSADGKTLATNAIGPYELHDETTIALWDAMTGKLVRRLNLPMRYVQWLHFSPDGRTLLTTGNDPVLRLWDTTTGKSILQWPAHTSEATSLALTPDGRFLVSGGLDGTVRLWEVSSGRQVRELAGHRWRCDVVAVAPNGKVILSGGSDGCIRLQDSDGRQLRRILLDGPPEEMTKLGHQVLALAVTPDSKRAATWSADMGALPPDYQVWDLVTGKALSSHPYTCRAINAPPFSWDARLALEQHVELTDLAAAAAGGKGGAPAYGGDGAEPVTVILREVATGKEILRLRQADGLLGFQAFAPDGRTILTVSSRQEGMGDSYRCESTLHFWEVATMKERLTIPCGSSNQGIQRAVYAPDGRTLATARNLNGAIELWDLLTAKELSPRFISGVEVNCFAFSPDSQRLASAHRDGSILIWDTGFAGENAGKKKVAPSQLEQWWTDLASEDARRAFAAVNRLTVEPQSIVDLLREHLRPAAELQPEKLRGLIAELDSHQFPQREAAKKQLAEFGQQAGPLLRAALQDKLSAEQRRSIEQLLDSLSVVRSPEALRHIRAIEILERISTPQARELLEKLAQGAAEARLTQEAKASLERLTKRAAAKP
jgi:WD40 repeat protein